MFKKFYNILSLRERALLTVFIWIILFVWTGGLFKDSKSVYTNLRSTAYQLKYQAQVISEKEDIKIRLNHALERLEPEKTYSSSQLVEKLDNIARKAGLNFDINSPSTQEGDIFNAHTVRIQFKKGGIADLIEFDQKIKEESPYLGLERMRIVANKADPRQLDAQFLVSSFELKNKSI
jgi:hypothetical protein